MAFGKGAADAQRRIMTAVFGAQWTGVVPLPAATGDLKYIREVAAKLDFIAGLRHNWDGEQGKPIEPRILAIASELLLPLSRFQPPVPRIAPVLGGGIQFEWEVAGRSLEIEILPDGSVEYLTAEGDRIEEGSLPDLPINEVRTLAGWVMGRR